jgi:hypothetical protein
VRIKGWMIVCLAVGQAMATQAELTYRFKFDGSVSGSTVDGTYTEKPQYTADVPAGGQLASSMEAGMDYGNKKSGFQLNNAVIAHQGSVSLWVKPDTLTSGTYILNLPGGLMLATLNGNSIALSDATYNWQLAAASTGTWNHVVATWDNTADFIEFYFNGSLVSSNALGSDVTSTYTLRVGGYELSDSAGSIDVPPHASPRFKLGFVLSQPSGVTAVEPRPTAGV